MSAASVSFAAERTRPRIAQLANFVGPSTGGIRTAVQALGAGFVDRGAERLLVVPGPFDELVETEHGTVATFRSPQVGENYRLIVEPWRVAELLQRFGPTSIEVNDRSTLVPLASWARRRGIGSVLYSHERLDSMLSLRTNAGAIRGTSIEGGIAMWNRLLMHRFDVIAAGSHYAAQGFPTTARVELVPLGVDLTTFRPHRRDGGGDDVLRLVHAGRLSREKSPALAVETALELHRRGLKVQLDVYGDGPHRAEIEAAAQEAPVVFHGHVASRERLAVLLSQADIALSVCPAETFGLAILEALACGTPVVTANVGGGRELVDAQCGAWGAPHPSALADAVVRVSQRPEVARRLAARQRAEAYSWTRAVDSMLEVHRRAEQMAAYRHATKPPLLARTAS